MAPWEREIHTYRILSGRTKIALGGRGGTAPISVLVLPPGPSLRLEAAEVYRDVLQECYLAGVLPEADATPLLRSRGLWTDHDAAQHELLARKIDDMKVGLFENWTHSNHRHQIRRALDVGRAELARLDGVLHCLDHVTCEGVAAAGKVRYLTGRSLADDRGIPLPLDWDGLDIVDEVIEHLVRDRLAEPEVRELCRNDPWRSYWSSREFAGRGLVDASAGGLTDEQRYCMMWSNIYDSIRESVDCPDDSILEDDDMLDGWMLKQKRERDAQRTKKRGDEVANEKVRNSDEVYLVADGVEDARRIDAINDEVARTIKAQRMEHLRARGQVPELEMPDTWSRFQMEASRAISDRIKGK